MSNEIERIEPKINNTPPEIIVMRSPVHEPQSDKNQAWTPWAIFGVIVAAIVVGNIVWWWGVSIYAQHKLGEVAEALAQEEKANEQKRREIFYQEAARHELERHSQKEENARIAWQHYHAEQQRQEQDRQRKEREQEREFILAQQRQWQHQNNYNQYKQLNNLSNAKTPEEIQAENCKSWINSNIADPSPDKKKYIKENCN